MKITKVSVVSRILSETTGEMSCLCVSARMGLRVGRKEHDNEQGNTEVDDGSRNLRHTLRNRSRRTQRQSSAQGQSAHGDESACAKGTHGQGPRPGTAYGEASRRPRKAPCAEARDRPPRSASAASGETSRAETPSPPQSHPPHGGLVRNRRLAPRRTRRRIDRRFHLTANTQPQTKKGTTTSSASGCRKNGKIHSNRQRAKK